MAYVFWISIFGTIFSFLIYPLCLLLFLRERQDVSSTKPFNGKISLIIAAHNEAARISAKIRNALELRFPRDRLEIIIVSDDSTDGTNEIVESFSEDGVTLLRSNGRVGKERAQAMAIQESSGDLLVFSDVATALDSDALHHVASEFERPDVGAISSVDHVLSKDGKVQGEGLYVRYEMWLRSLESRRAGLVGMSGSLFAARRQVCTEWDLDAPSDFATALGCVERGYIAHHSRMLVGTYHTIDNPRNEFARKSRTVLRGMVALFRNRGILSFRRYGAFAFQVFGHKLMRWLTPWFMVALFVSNLFLIGVHQLYELSFYLQCLFYLFAVLGWVFPRLCEIGIFRLISFFVQSNAGILAASIRFLLGHRVTIWNPSTR